MMIEDPKIVKLVRELILLNKEIAESERLLKAHERRAIVFLAVAIACFVVFVCLATR